MRRHNTSQEITDRQGLADLLNSRQLHGEAIEVGTHLGIFANQILSRWRAGVLHCVDPWKNNLPDYPDDVNERQDRDGDFEQCQELLKEFIRRDRVRFHRMLSDEAVSLFADNSMDMVYLDGNHTPKWIEHDLKAYWPKVRPGGIFAGHDFSGEWRHSVRSAVISFAEQHDLAVLVTSEEYKSWYIWKQ